MPQWLRRMTSPPMNNQILLADDDPLLHRVVGFKLAQNGWKVISAYDGAEALKLARELHPRLIILDGMMPVLDGYEAMRELKQKRQAVPPVIAVTAHAMRGDREKCLAAGADDYLPKPVATDELVRMLHKWLAKERSRP